MSEHLTTTLNTYGIGSSFTKDHQYFVSTCESPPSSNRYESLIKFLGSNTVPIVVVVSHQIKGAVRNHIALTRMGISTNRTDWNENSMVEFIPHELINLIESANLNSNSFKSEYVDSLLKMSGINYPPENSGFFKKLKSTFFG